MTLSAMGLEVSVPEVPLHESPLVPVTVHDAASVTLQRTCVVELVCTILRERESVPDGVPLRQVDEPAEQKYGEAQVSPLVTAHDASVY